jgi:hypothetical protein
MNAKSIKAKLNSAAITLSLGVLIFSFQNCSPVKFENGKPAFGNGSKFDRIETPVDMIGNVDAPNDVVIPEEAAPEESTPVQTSTSDEVQVVIEPAIELPVVVSEEPKMEEPKAEEPKMEEPKEVVKEEAPAVPVEIQTQTTTEEPKQQTPNPTIAITLPEEFQDAAECACGKGKGKELFVNINGIELVKNGVTESLPGLGQVDANQVDARIQAAIGDRAFDEVHVKFGWGSFARCANKSIKPIEITSEHGNGNKKTCAVSPLLSLAKNH